MNKPDKILWDKIVSTKKFEKIVTEKETIENTYVPVPYTVARILQRQKDDYTLICYIRKETRGTYHKEIMMMTYVRFDGEHFWPKAGMCCDWNGNQYKWEQLAKEIAEEWPQFAVKKRNKK